MDGIVGVQWTHSRMGLAMKELSPARGCTPQGKESKDKGSERRTPKACGDETHDGMGGWADRHGRETMRRSGQRGGGAGVERD